MLDVRELTPVVELEVNVREVIVKSGLLQTNTGRLGLQAKNSIDITLLVRSAKLSPLDSLGRVDASTVGLNSREGRDGNGLGDNAGDSKSCEELHGSECVNECPW
jgi:hypothetical protein